MTSPPRPERVALIGLRGSGKTTVGRLLARRLDWEFVDTDEQIERQTGYTIREIFVREGEPKFRVIEAEVLQRVFPRRQLVISAGGGAVLTGQNQPLFSGTGTLTVWLDADSGVLAQRIEADRENHGQRPRLTSAMTVLEEVDQLRAQRSAIYQRLSHARIDTGGVSADEAVRAIEQMITPGVDRDA